MTGPADAVHPHGSGTAIDVEATPGADRDEFPAGYNPWRRRVLVRVRAQAVEGEANAAVLRVVALFFGVPTRAVSLAAGATTRQKRVVLASLDPAQALQKLSAAMSTRGP